MLTSSKEMELSQMKVEYYPTSDTEQAPLFK